MKGRLGKWLAVLLSVSMLAGIAPVYGADISMESDFSSGAAETEEQPDVQEGIRRERRGSRRFHPG